jgi:hypothetical protein
MVIFLSARNVPNLAITLSGILAFEVILLTAYNAILSDILF